MHTVKLSGIPGTRGETVVSVYDGLGDLHRHLKATERDARAREFVTSTDHEFAGRDWSEALKALATGDTANVAAAAEMEKACADLLDWSARKFSVVNRIAGGGALNVSAWLAGRPDIVRQRVRLESEAAPLTVVVASNASASVSRRSLINRGVAILALVRLLSATRPVTLWSVAASPVNGGINTGMAMKLDTAPLVLGQASFVLSDPAFGRRLSFAARVVADPRVKVGNMFPPFAGSSEKAKAIGGAVMAGALGVPVEDVLYIPRAGERDDDGLTASPVDWLRLMLAKFGRFGETAEG